MKDNTLIDSTQDKAKHPTTGSDTSDETNARLCVHIKVDLFDLIDFGRKYIRKQTGIHPTRSQFVESKILEPWAKSFLELVSDEPWAKPFIESIHIEDNSE